MIGQYTKRDFSYNKHGAIVMVDHFVLFCSQNSPPDCLFFSSSRRHTISTRDWSSDVCSSDLISACPLPCAKCSTNEPFCHHLNPITIDGVPILQAGRNDDAMFSDALQGLHRGDFSRLER